MERFAVLANACGLEVVHPFSTTYLVKDIVLFGRIAVKRPRLQVLLMSGFNAGMLVLNEGWHFLLKPFIPSTLRAIVMTLISSDRASTSKFIEYPLPDTQS
jgi:hypothetical protein